MCDKMAISAYIFKIVEKGLFLTLSGPGGGGAQRPGWPN